MQIRHFTILLILAIFALSACKTSERPETITIKLIETSDVHGAIFPYDFGENQASNHSLAQVHSFVKNQKAMDNQVVIFLDNGDILQGDPSVYYYNYIETQKKHLVSEVMNFMAYDAATLGNHDIEAGHKVYDKLRKDFNFPWLAANAVETNSDQPYFEPYTIIEKQGVRIAVLGLITPAIPQWLPEILWQGMIFEDMIESAKYWVDYIKKNEKPDLMVGLFHSGYDHSYNKENADTPKNENAAGLIAEQVPGFDLIFVGHDHHGWNKNITNWAGNPVRLLGTTSRAADVAVATATLSLNKNTNHYTKTITGEIVKMDTVKPDPEFIQKFDPEFQIIKNYVAEPVGSITASVSTQDAFFGDAAFTDLIHQAQLDLTGAEISFTAPLSFNKTINEGEIFVRDLFKIYRYENMIYTMKLGGQEIKDYLEYSAQLWFVTMNSAEDNMLNFKKDSSGQIEMNDGRAQLAQAYFNFDNAEGIRYTVDLTKPSGERINIAALNDGQPFDLNKTYTVALNSYRGNGGGGHLTAGAKIRSELLADRIITSTEKDFRYYLMEWIRDNSPVTPATNNNWQILPESFAAQAALRDRELLFGK